MGVIAARQATPVHIHHDESRTVVVATVDGENAGTLSYHRNEEAGILVAYSTIVRPRFGGRGVGSALVLALAEWAEATGQSIDPTCWFVDEWLDRTTEHAHLRHRAD